MYWRKNYKLLFIQLWVEQDWQIVVAFKRTIFIMAKIAERIKRVNDTICASCQKANRNPAEVKLVVVTKSASEEQIGEVLRFGITDLGENRVQQLRKVAAQMSEFLGRGERGFPSPEKVNWHMIGHLQRNKVSQALPIVSLIHSVDTLRLAEEINAAASKMGICPRVLLQVNTSEEPQKYGVPVGAAMHLAEQIETLPNVKLAGLMTMAPLTRDKNLIRACFVRARETAVEMKGERIVGPAFTELSMGMSSDYDIAIEEGATIVRIGSAIFAN